MKRHSFLLIAVIAGSFLVSACQKKSTTPVIPPDIANFLTAKSAYQIALVDAKKFSPDIFLVDLNTIAVQENGFSRTWYFSFYSPLKNTNYRINMVDGKISRTFEKDDGKKNPLIENWVDTDTIATTAIPKCSTTIESEYYFSLSNNNGNSIWSVKCVGENNVVQYLDFNAESGVYQTTRKE